MLDEIDKESAKQLHPNNILRVIRAIEVFKTTGKTMFQTQLDSRNNPSPYNPIMIALSYSDRQLLYQRINKRVDEMVAEGLLAEVMEIIEKGFSKTASQAIGYKEFLPYINADDKSPELLESCIEKLKMETRRYSKRQLTWLRRDKRYFFIYKDQLENPEQVFDLAIDYIRKNL
ncbi:MAG: tRNA dimethylallyltransferase, partial [Oscillospiraceae bacterium]